MSKLNLLWLPSSVGKWDGCHPRECSLHCEVILTLMGATSCQWNCSLDAKPVLVISATVEIPRSFNSCLQYCNGTLKCWWIDWWSCCLMPLLVLIDLLEQLASLMMMQQVRLLLGPCVYFSYVYYHRKKVMTPAACRLMFLLVNLIYIVVH